MEEPETSNRRYLISFALILLLAAGFYSLGVFVGKTYAVRPETQAEAPTGSAPPSEPQDVRSKLTFYEAVNQDSAAKSPAPDVSGQNTVAELPAVNPAVARFTVQVAALVRRADVEEIEQALEKKGYDAKILEPAGGEDSYFRVIVGDYATKEEASRMGARLRDDGFRGFVRLRNAD